MTGIQFLSNEKGEKTAVLLDLKKYGELWEDFYDSIIAEKRKNEPRETLSSVKGRLKKTGKLNG